MRCREWGARLAVRTLARPHPHPPALSPAACWYPRPRTLTRAPSPTRTAPTFTPLFALTDTVVRTPRHPHAQSSTFTFTPSFAVVGVVVRARSLPAFMPRSPIVCGFVRACLPPRLRPCFRSCLPLFAPACVRALVYSHRSSSSCTYFTYN